MTTWAKVWTSSIGPENVGLGVAIAVDVAREVAVGVDTGELAETVRVGDGPVTEHAVRKHAVARRMTLERKSLMPSTLEG